MAITRPSFGPISSPYGYRKVGSEATTYHGGVDFVGAVGSPIRAVKDGTVYVSAPNGTYNRYGNLVVIKHDDPSEAPYSLYAHLNSLRVRKGQRVKAGQIVGTMGNTSGDRTDPNHTVRTHLHFELLKAFPAPPDTGRVDPMPYLNPTSSFYPVPSPTPPSPPPPSQPSYYTPTYFPGPYQYTGYSYGQGPLRGFGGMGKPIDSNLESVKWTSNTPHPFATAPGAGLAEMSPGASLLTALGLLFATPVILSMLARDNTRTVWR